MSLKDTIRLEDAARLGGALAFNLMIKPAGSLCNLDCAYCYYLDKADIYGGVEPRMSLETLELVIRKYIEANEVPEVTFNWHGGEPTVMGLDFYRKAVEFEKKYAGGKTIRNTLQTNGTLLNPDWAKFFRDEDFLLGISIDGPQDIHDKYRRDKGGVPTWSRVMKSIELLHREGVQYNTMSTVNKLSAGRGAEIYRFLKGLGTRYMQFMPVVEHVTDPKSRRPHIVDPDTEGAKLAPWSISSIAFGRFLCDIFDVWVRSDVGRYFVGQFDAALACWCGVMPGSCSYSPTCGGNSVVEHNGDIYCCDHFVYPKYKVGNILTDDLASVMKGPLQTEFGLRKRSSLPRKCERCRYLFACNGECPKHRFNRTESGETGLSALCEGYQLFYSHVEPYMEKMKSLLAEGRSAAEIIPYICRNV